MIPREARAPRPCRTRIRVHGAKEKIVPKQKAHSHPTTKKHTKSAKWHSIYICTLARDENIRKPRIREN